MDFVNKLAGGVKGAGQGQDQAQNQNQNQNQGEGQAQGNSGGGILGGLMGKVNNAAGGGRESEKDEDYLDKGMSLIFAYHFHSRLFYANLQLF
jgi:hypothetical protein